MISANGRDGIAIVGITSTGNAILGNSIHSNSRRGIELAEDGVAPNDGGDSDAGPNHLPNFPILAVAISDSSGTLLEGTLDSSSNATFRLELFSNSTCDPSGQGEGETFLGTTSVTTDGSGNANFTVTLSAIVDVGHFVTATATDPEGNTSEFSQCRQAIMS